MNEKYAYDLGQGSRVAHPGDGHGSRVAHPGGGPGRRQELPNQVAAQRLETTTARVTADTRRRWDEVRQAREQIMSRQEQVIQQTRADVRRQVERMRAARAAIITPEPARSTSTAVAVKPDAQATRASTPLTPIPGPRFDFDSRRVAWEQRRREQAEKRREEIARLNEPYQAQRRMLEEKRRQALEDQQAARKPHIVGAHQVTGASTPLEREVETVIAINVVVEEPVVPVVEIAAPVAFAEVETAPKPSPWNAFRGSQVGAVARVEPVAEAPVRPSHEYRQNSLFGEDGE